MKSVYFFLFLCAALFSDCSSFDFRSLFNHNYNKASPSSVHISSSSKPTYAVLKQENVSADDNLDAEYNVSISSLVEIFENSSDSYWELSSEMNGTAEYVASSSSSSVVENITQVPAKNGETSSASSVSSESSTQENNLLNVTQIISFNNSTEEQEKVVLGTQTPSSFSAFTKSIYQKTAEWVGDTYTLSILLPVAAGVLFAVTIIITIATCRCIRRSCRRRRFRKRVLPDSIKTLRPSDRARLLGDCESSDEEF